MKKLINHLPTMLLTSLIGFFFYKEPNIAQAIITSFICLLVGYRYYLESKTSPDYLSIFKEEFAKYQNSHIDMVRVLEKEIIELKDNQSKLSIVKTQQEKRSNHRW